MATVRVVYAEPVDKHEVDSLLAVFEKTDNAQRYETGNTLMQLFRSQNLTDETIIFNIYSRADSVNMLVAYWSSWFYYENEFWQAAIDWAEFSLDYIKTAGDENILSDAYHLQGLCYFRLGNFSTSAERFRLTYEIDKRRGDVSDMCNTLNCIAGTYIANNQPELAEPYIKEAIKLNSTIDEPEKMSVYLGTASEIYHQMGDDEKALLFASQGLQIERRLERKGQTGKRLSQMAAAYIGMNRLAEAKAALEEAVPLLKESRMFHSLGICENQLGDICLEEDKTKEAVLHYQTAYDVFFEQGDLYNQQRSLYGLYVSQKDCCPQEAMDALHKYSALKDSIYTTETEDRVSQYNAQYKNDMLEAEKMILQQKNRNYLIMGVLLMCVLLLVVVIIILVIRQRHQKESRQLNKHITELQEHNEQLQTWYENVLKKPNEESGDKLSEGEKEFLTKVVSVVNSEMEKGGVDADIVAKKLHLSPYQLRNRLMDMTGKSPREYILDIRMQKAVHLLETQRNLTIQEVAFRCGYADGSNFVHAFRRHYGVSPTAYRNRNKENHM